MKHNRITTLLLLTSLLTASLFSCGGDTTTPAVTDKTADSSADTTPVTEELDSLAARQLVDDELGEADFSGRTFRILGDNACED